MLTKFQELRIVVKQRRENVKNTERDDIQWNKEEPSFVVNSSFIGSKNANECKQPSDYF